MTEEKKYKVLARKYRPQKFEDLVGQELLVKILSNAINNDRLAHAYILTGVRGVGKTTTARLIAMSINCKNRDKKNCCLLYTSPSPRDMRRSRMPSSA